MVAMLRPWIPAYIVLVFFICVIPLSSSQPSSQNIETFYPSQPPPPNNPPIPTPLTPTKQPQQPPPSPAAPAVAPLPPKSSTNSAVAKAVAATAASTLVIAGFLFFMVQRYAVARRRAERAGTGSDGGERTVPHNDFTRSNGDPKGLIVDENGLDVIYWRKLEGMKNSIRKEAQHPKVEEEEEETIQRGDRHRKPEPIQENPLLREKSSTSYNQISPEPDPYQIVVPALPSAGIALKAVEKSGSSIQPSTPAGKPESSVQSLAHLPQPTPSPQPPPPQSLLAAPKKLSPAPPPPPPLPAKKNPTPPPPPPPLPTSPQPPPPQSLLAVPKKLSPAPPPPPPPPAKKNLTLPPPPPKMGGLALSSKPPPPPPTPVSKGMPSDGKARQSSSRESTTENANGQVKLKPLHWDKVNTNTDHSMVWDKIDGGSFRFDGDLMEALFGYVVTDRKSPQRNNHSLNTNGRSSGPSSRVFILDPRKSQNTAIVLRSIAVSRKEILDSLMEGQGLNAETLEKLTRIAPTEEEESQILAFEGDPTRLADAESFLFHLLKAIPSAFTRLNAMLFRSNYHSEILHLKKSLQTLELACRELRTRGLFLKLLEAILKAGNRMNAGTARGNAQAFNLTALRKLSDVKSTDGKVTLLHFVVEEVVRSEGKRCVMNRSRSMSRNSSRSSSDSSVSSKNSSSKEEGDKEYIMLGLPMVGGLSAEFSNVKKAATIDYDAFASTCSALTNTATEIRQLLAQCATSRGEGFVREMEGFLKAADEELKAIREQRTEVMELVKRTREYYQAGASKDKGARPLQLFVIVKDFLGMVDQVCVDIARNLQKRKAAIASAGSSSPKSPASKIPVKFPNLPAHFLSDKSKSDSSDTDDDF